MVYYKFALILSSKRAITIVIYYKFSTCILVLLTIKIIENWRSPRMFSLKKFISHSIFRIWENRQSGNFKKLSCDALPLLIPVSNFRLVFLTNCSYVQCLVKTTTSVKLFLHSMPARLTTRKLLTSSTNAFIALLTFYRPFHLLVFLPREWGSLGHSL